MSRLLFLFMVVIPFIQARRTLHGYTLYDPSKYECKIVDGGWTDWSCFGPCSVSCGKGYQKRYRHCTAPVPKYGGKTCSGDRIEARECDTKLKCPVDGGWSDEVKGKCTKSCGGGIVKYTKTCTRPAPKHCGKPCTGPAVRTEACNVHKCPKWTEWTCTKCYKDKITKKCKKTCDRECLYRKKDKTYCTGPSTEDRYCPPQKCKPNIPTRGPCTSCKEEAEVKASIPKYGKDFVGLACRATSLADFCKQKKNNGELSKNGGFPANHWFWIHCSPDGPWCKPCATRNLVFNKKCDACEKTADGPCTGLRINDTEGEDTLNDDDLW